MKISAHFWDEGPKISIVIIINSQSRTCQVCLVLLLFLTLGVPGWSSAHRTRLCVRSRLVRASTITTFGSVFFKVGLFWINCCIVFLNRNITVIGLVMPVFFPAMWWAVSMCSGLMCFRSSQWWKTLIQHIAFLLTLVNSYWTVFVVLQPDCWRDWLHHLTALRHRGGSTDRCHRQPPDASFPQIHLSA